MFIVVNIGGSGSCHLEGRALAETGTIGGTTLPGMHRMGRLLLIKQHYEIN